MKKIKFVCLLLVLSMVLSLLLCGCVPETDPNEIGNRTVVNIWLRITSAYDISWWKAQFKAYNSQSKDYFVKVSWVDTGAWDSKLLSARENNSAPDIITYSIGAIAQQVSYGVLSPLNDYIPNLSTYLEDFEDDVVANITDLNGNVYGIPRFVEPGMMMYYRKDILSAAGWDSAPTTLAQLEQCCSDVTKLLASDKSYNMNRSMQVASANNEYGWVSWAVQAQLTGKQSALTEDWTAADLSGFEDVGDYWLNLHSFDGVAAQNLTSGGYVDEYAAILEGKCAIQQCGSWIYGCMYSEESYADMIDKIGVAVWPTESGNTEGEILCSMGGWSLGIDKGAAHPEGAADFIKWCLLEDDAGARLYEYFKEGHFCKISPRKSVNALISATEIENNQMRDLLVNVLIPNSMMEPTYPWEISQYLGNAYTAYVAGGVTIKDALKAAEASINTYIRQNNVAASRFN